MSSSLRSSRSLARSIGPLALIGWVLGSVGVAQTHPNILMIIADDLGVEQLSSYGVGLDPAVTPNLDRLATEGMLFRNVWSNPVCSSTRATIQTGLFSFRTGVGGTIDPPELGLRHDLETTLAEMLDLSPAGYTTAAFGKWHLNGEDRVGGFGFEAPRTSGFDHFEGTMRNLEVFFGGNYFAYEKVENGAVEDVVDGYVTTDTVDWALDYLNGAPEPWFGYVAFHAPHLPYHLPPSELSGAPGCIDGNSGDEVACFKAMIEAMDSEIGRLLQMLDSDRPIVVVFLGDNGTDERVAEFPFSVDRAKGTLWEGGINVPLIVWSPGLTVAGESDALVNTTDLFATLAEIAEVDLSAIPVLDSVSITPYLLGNEHPTPRDLLFADLFTPNGCQPTSQSGQAIRDARYKLIRVPPIHGGGEVFYDLSQDRWEEDDLLPNLTPQQQAAYDELSAKLDNLVRGPGDACTAPRQCCSRSCLEGVCQ